MMRQAFRAGRESWQIISGMLVTSPPGSLRPRLRQRLLTKQAPPSNTRVHLDASEWRKSISDTASGGASNATGFSNTDRRLRSVLAHPMGLPLLAHFNDEKIESKDFSELYDDDDWRSVLPNPEQLDKVFSSAVKEWNEGKELHLTQILSKKLKELGLFPSSQGLISGTNVRGGVRDGKMDLLLVSGPEETASPVTLVEFGLKNQDWWQKLDQASSYVELLRNPKDPEGLFFKKAMLLAVITVDVSKGTSNLEARFGAFLCIPNGSDFRMSLLWREETNTLEGASTAFGKVMRASCQCLAWRDKDPKLDYTYLGPNCCRFGEVVLRAYDTRFRYTQRRPLLYLTDDLIFPGEPAAQTVLSFQDDATNVLEFGELYPEDFMLEPKEWLWEFQGKVLVIFAPYRHGRHYAVKPTDFLPIIEHLEYMHRLGYVHGDIRAFNMVLGGSTKVKDADQVDTDTGTTSDISSCGDDAAGDGFDISEGRLIDFDFGGKQVGEKTVYPYGYKSELPDGLRIGKEFRPIQYRDDWDALGQIIFAIHNLVPPEKIDLDKRKTLSIEQLDLMGVDGLSKCRNDEKGKGVIESLKRFLKDAEKAGYEIQLKERFAECFTNPDNTNTGMATGSPDE